MPEIKKLVRLSDCIYAWSGPPIAAEQLEATRRVAETDWAVRAHLEQLAANAVPPAVSMTTLRRRSCGRAAPRSTLRGPAFLCGT